MDFVTLLAAKIDAGKAGIPKVSDDSLLTGVLGLAYWAAGIVAVIIIIIAGIFYVTSDGDASKIKRAREAILYAIVGLVVIMMAAVITQFIAGRFS